MTKLSVIVPVYNVAPYLRECLDSLFRAALLVRDKADIEVVCVDDGSTDGSQDIVDEYARDRGMANIAFKAVHQGNGGVSSARNRGLDAALGEWILFVDSDDFVRDSYFLDVCGLVAECSGADLLGFGMVPFYGGRIDWADGPSLAAVDVGIDHAVVGELAEMSIYRFAYRRAVIDGIRFRPYSHGEDLVFMAEVFARSRKCFLSSRKEYVYRFRDGSATHVEVSSDNMKTVVAAFVDVFKALAESGKQIGDGYRLHRARVWLCEQPRIILRKTGSPGWDEAWSSWLDSMGVAAEMPFFSRWQRFVARIVFASRSRVVVKLFCLLPAWLGRRMDTGRH